MASFATHNLPPIESGNTFRRKRVGTDFDFTEALVEISFAGRGINAFTLNNGLTKDGQGFFIEPFVLEWPGATGKPNQKWPPGEYKMEVTFTRTDGAKRTYLKMIFKVTD